MGHRFSKTAATATKTQQQPAGGQPIINGQELSNQTTIPPLTTTGRIPIPSNTNTNSHIIGPTINFQIQESPTGGGLLQPEGGAQQQSGGSIIDTTTTCLQHNLSTAANSSGILQQSLGYNGSASSISGSCSNSLTSVNNLSCGRQIIIKIQLAKMENGNEVTTTTTTTTTSAPACSTNQADISLEALTADCNLNSTELLSETSTGVVVPTTQILNVTLNSAANSSSCSSTNNLTRTAGSSFSSATVVIPSSSSSSVAAGNNNNNNYFNQQRNSTNIPSSSSLMDAANRERLERLSEDEIVEETSGDVVEYCEVLESEFQPMVAAVASSNSSGPQITEESELESNVCCRRKSKSLANNASGSSASSTTKRRCRKCSCRDAIRRILDPSLSRSSNKAQKQLQQQQQQLEREQKAQRTIVERHSIPNLPSNRIVNALQRNSMHSTGTSATAAAAALVIPAVTTATTTAAAGWNTTAAGTNGSDVIIPLTTTPSQFVVVQCAIVNPATTAVTSATLPANSIISITQNPVAVAATSSSVPSSTTSSSTAAKNNDLKVQVPYSQCALRNPVKSSTAPTTGVPATATTYHAPPSGTATNSSSSSSSSATVPAPVTNGPIVHSQVDFVHYLVPDLERITNSSFYWGKMDRYEAERLLEGKEEGTFLLRDSAQEEFLFSVTFRKYGRSLHARIEQSGHRFSFDCHDPGVFTASTVTGLLEHYKDPACVMFFEPMLTIPLHRKNCFSLQQLCRATIVSNTTYDGINELELPVRLKSYLKEYHYKQKLRVKSNEPTYNSVHCK